MKFKLPSKSIKIRLVYVFTAVVCAALLLFGIAIYWQQRQSIKSEAFSKLTAIRDLKANRITAWIDEITFDLRTLTQDSRIALVGDIDRKAHINKLSIDDLRGNLTSYVRYHPSISDIQIIDAKTGCVLICTDKQQEGADRSTSPNFTETLRTKKLFIYDIHYSSMIRRNRMSFSMPVFQYGIAQQVAFILVADIDLDPLNELLRERTGMGDTVETLIVNKDALVLSELRWRQDAPLKMTITAKPAVLASQGKTGVVETRDYRGVEVLAAVTFIPGTKWGMVVKQDQSELYEPIYAMTEITIYLFLICLAGAVFLALTFARSISKPLVEMQTTSEAIAKGDLTARNHIYRDDEFGFLSRAFNNMADHIQSYIAIQTADRDIMESMVHQSLIDSFCNDLLDVLMQKTYSDMGVFYLLGADDKFSPVSSVGLSQPALESFDASIREGMVGSAIASRKVCNMKDIPSDTVFTYKTFAGTMIPREVFVIPIIVKDRVTAVIVLASVTGYPPESSVIIDTALISFANKFANLLAEEETRRLSIDLAAKNTELEMQTIELKKQSDMLYEQNTELEVQAAQVIEANRLKSEFLSNMSHELRTPLNSVLALSRVLIMQGKDQLSPEQINYIEIIERNGKHLLSLINDILDLAKIESGKYDLSFDEFSLSEKIMIIAENMQPICLEKGIELIIDLPDNLPVIQSDERRIFQALLNIIGNAVKFTEKGQVIISARQVNDAIEVSVIDTGIGIPEKDLPYIFDEFRQVDGSTTRQFEGTGLGLAIASKYIRLLGGHISAKSVLGEGSTFTVMLPLTMSYHAIEGEMEDKQTIQKTDTILVVDDNPMDINIISAYLKEEGYNTIAALSGKEALRLAEIHQPFAITLDVLMPDKDGWDTLQALKQNPCTSSIPVIIVSISNDKSTGLALGAIGAVSKPVDGELLISEIRRIAPADNVSILVTDDDTNDRMILVDMLKSKGYTVIEARNGSECLELAAETLPSIILLDIAMPVMSGFEALEKLRSDPCTRPIPVIIVTAMDISGEEQKILNGQAAAVIEKSQLDSNELFTEIKQILDNIKPQPEKQSPPLSARERRLLLVEDSEPAIIQIKMVLESAGYIVDTARGGQEALDMMQTAPPDGIILDLMMPNVDGFTVLEQMRSTPATKHTPVLILTAKNLTSDDLNRISANNVQQLIQKGDVNKKELLKKIECLFSQKNDVKKASVIPAKQSNKAFTPKLIKDRQISILAAEDNTDNMATLRAILQNQCMFIESVDGEDAVEKAIQYQPDLILLDISLPLMDGYAVMKCLRDNAKTKDIPVVILTAHAMNEDRVKIMDTGCNGYLTKPIEVQRLYEEIERLVGPLNRIDGETHQ